MLRYLQFWILTVLDNCAGQHGCPYSSQDELNGNKVLRLEGKQGLGLYLYLTLLAN